jgi:hypothetical protein
MMGRIAAIRIAIAATGTLVLFLLLTGCAPREMAGGAREAGAAQNDAGRTKSVEAASDTLAGARAVRQRG